MSYSLCAQTSIVIKSKIDSSKTKTLKFDRIYTINTADLTYYSKIVGSNDSCLKIGREIFSADSSKAAKKTLDSKTDGRVYYGTSLIDTTYIPFRKINYLKKDFLKNRKWLDPISWTIIGGGVGIASVYVFNLDKNYGVKNWMGLLGGICVITVPIIYIGNKTVKYDMKNKWAFQD